MKSMARYDKCKIDFISKDILEKHTAQAHPINVPKPQQAIGANTPKPTPVLHPPINPDPIPVLNSPRENIVGNKPLGVVRRQYNCHECDYQGHRSKALFKHSLESGHKKIDSLTETCYTCRQECDNFISLMKHRKAAHYSIISECHGFKSGSCWFGDQCYYRHGIPSVSGSANSEAKSSDSFQQGLQEFPPDLTELTQGFQELMSKFLSGRDRQRSRHQGH